MSMLQGVRPLPSGLLPEGAASVRLLPEAALPCRRSRIHSSYPRPAAFLRFGQVAEGSVHRGLVQHVAGLRVEAPKTYAAVQIGAAPRLNVEHVVQQ